MTNDPDILSTPLPPTAKPKPKSAFVNPYRGIESKTLPDGTPGFKRVTLSVDHDPHMFVRRIRPDNGTIETVFNSLYVKFINELKRRGIEDGTEVERFERFVIESKLVLPGEVDFDKYVAADKRYADRPSTTGPGVPTGNPVPPSETSNVGGPTSGGDQSAQEPAGQPSGVRRRTKRKEVGGAGNGIEGQ